MEDINIITTVGTGLARKTNVRILPAPYLEKSVIDVINYLQKVIEKDGSDDDKRIMTDVKDQMKENFIIQINGANVNPSHTFGRMAEKVEVKDVGEDGVPMKCKNIEITISSVQEGGMFEKDKPKREKKTVILPKKLTINDVCFALFVMITEKEEGGLCNINHTKLRSTIKNFESALSQYDMSIKGDDDAEGERR
jgi:hypothetical protein